MATRTVVTLVDDLTGEAGSDVGSVAFGLDGASYDIDLSEKNAAALRLALADYVAHARRTGGRVRRGGRGGGTGRQATVTSVTSAPSANTTVAANTAHGRKRAGEIREWAKANGIPISDRGRIPAEVAERYDAEQRQARVAS